MSIPAPEEQIGFIANIQRLLEEGSFTSTYKFALLLALADISVEDGDDSGDPFEITTRRIARKFVEYYWQQGRPWIVAGGGGNPSVLHQNTGRQAKIVSLVCEARSQTYGDRVGRSGKRRRRDSLLREVARTIETMPLWKLQTMEGETVPFLYENRGKGRDVILKPGIAFCFRRFHALIRQLTQNAWVRFVRELRTNRVMVGDTADLADFLFGPSRAALDDYRPVLTEIQSGSCFYCGRSFGKASEVDHFVPWSRYPVDLGHNFVLACRPCNNGKRDFLAAERFLDRWMGRNDRFGSVMGESFDESRLVHDGERSVQVASWAYGQAEVANANVWAGRIDGINRYERLGTDWRNRVGLSGFRTGA